ncbi:MAG: hypothetical protein IJU56_05450 [Clostridia bacterium]|nr:hypothetical protein [Clostridia bacterium]
MQILTKKILANLHTPSESAGTKRERREKAARFSFRRPFCASDNTVFFVFLHHFGCNRDETVLQ